MNLYSLLLLVFLSSCTSLYEMNLTVRPHLEEFEKYFKKKVTVPVEFRSLRGSTVGVCFWVWKDSPLWVRKIFLDPEYWLRATEWERESVLFHEIAHCQFNLEHDNSMKEGIFFSRPKSIMHKNLFWSYVSERDYYLEELQAKINGGQL